MTRRLRLGSRLLLALVATAATTLGVAALALLSPLQDRLRDQARESVAAAALSARPRLEDLLEREGGVGTMVTAAVFDLADRANARVTLVDADPYPLVDAPDRLDTETGPLATDDVYRVFIHGRTVESSTAQGGRIAIPLRTEGRFAWILAVRKPETDVAEVVGEVRGAFLTAALAGLAVASLLGLWLSTRLTQRLGRLRRAAQRLAAEGPEAPAPDDRGHDEVGDLARAFAAMQLALRRQEDARRAFVATASHELRTPLTSLQGTMELLAEDLADPRAERAEALRSVRAAQGELHRLGRLATELLELSRLDAGAELQPEPVELGELGRAVAAEFRLRAAERGIDVRAPAPPAGVWARADPGAAARVVRILVDNALRFCPSGEAVVVTAAYADGRAAIEVADPGPGVPPQDRERIFERFQRGSDTGGEGGFGLGLAIGRELAHRSGGDLILADGAGARFVLALPPAPPGG